jgi:hypothetical protein
LTTFVFVRQHGFLRKMTKKLRPFLEACTDCGCLAPRVEVSVHTLGVSQIWILRKP